MKIIKCLAVAIYPLFFTLIGCNLRRPTLQASYVDTGSTMVWPATGRPFQIYWLEDQSPCLPSIGPVSDGKKDAVCFANTPGIYHYYVDKPSSRRHRETKAPPPVFIMMHVGNCSSCSIMLNNGKDSPQNQDGGSSPSSGDIAISCVSGMTTATPLTGPPGLTVGGLAIFSVNGSYTNHLTLTFKANDCDNNPNPGQPFQIKGSSGACVVNNSPTISYSAQVDGCGTSPSPLTLSVSPSK